LFNHGDFDTHEKAVKAYNDFVNEIGKEDTLYSLNGTDKYEFLFNSEPVAELTGHEFEKVEGKTLREQVNEFFDSIGNKVNSVFGEVILDNRAFKNDIAHGVGREKIAAFKALPQILKKGIEVLPMGSYKENPNIKSGMIAAPINISEKEYIAIAVIRKKDENNNRLYLHEVTLKEKLLDSNNSPIIQDINTNQEVNPPNSVFVTKSGIEDNSTWYANQGEVTKVLQNIVTAKQNAKNYSFLTSDNFSKQNQEKEAIGKQIRYDIEQLLKPLGITVGQLSELEERFGIKGLFNPAMLKNYGKNISDIIKVAQGVEGDFALSEEFGHLIELAMRGEPIMQRLTNYLSNNEDIVKSIFDREGSEQYDLYLKKYNNRQDLMLREAIGKLLGQTIVKNERLKIESTEKLNILQRFIRVIKNL
jgi:hypothetical protein